MQVTEHDSHHEPEPGATPGTGPGSRPSDTPPVGEPLVVSRRNPSARPPVAPDVVAAGADIPVRSDRAVEPEQLTQLSPPMAGEVVLVTASGGALGRAIARELDSRGARVLLLDPDPAALVATLDSLPAGHAVPLLCDLALEGAVASVVEFVRRATSIDAIVHVTAEVPVAADAAHVDGPDSTDLTRRLRSRVVAPIELVDGLGDALSDDAPVVLIRDVGSSSVLDRVAPDLVREQLGNRCRVCDVDYDHDLVPGRVAEVLADLLVLDDVAVERLVLVGGTSDPRGEAGTGR